MAEQSLTIVMRARDEASAKLGSIGRTIGAGLSGSLAGTLVSLGSVTAAAMTVTRAINAVGAASAAAADVSSSSADEVIAQQVAVSRAYLDVARGIPGIGEIIVRMADRSNVALEKIAKRFREIDAAAKKNADTIEKTERSLELLAAANRGAGAVELETLRAYQAAQDRDKQLVDARAAVIAARQHLETTQATSDTEALRKRARLLAGTAAGPEAEQAAAMAAYLEEEARKKLRAAERKYARLRNMTDRYGEEELTRIKKLRDAEKKAAEEKAKEAADTLRRDREAQAAKAKSLDAALAAQERALIEDPLKRDLAELMARTDRLRAEAEAATKPSQDDAQELGRVEELAWRREELLTRIAAAGEAERAAILKRYADQQEKDAAARAQREADEWTRRVEQQAADRASLEDAILTAAGKTREVEARRAKREFDALRERYASDPEMLRLIAAAEEARRIESGRTGGKGAAKRESAADISRFLTRVQGVEPVPAWAAEANGLSKKSVGLLEQIAQRVGLNVNQVRLLN